MKAPTTYEVWCPHGVEHGTLPRENLCVRCQRDCAGDGRCHGCMGWCDYCGDVSRVCDSQTCMQHRCANGCGTTRPSDDEDVDLRWTCVQCLARLADARRDEELEYAEHWALKFEEAGNHAAAKRRWERAAKLQTKYRA